MVNQRTAFDWNRFFRRFSPSPPPPPPDPVFDSVEDAFRAMGDEFYAKAVLAQAPKILRQFAAEADNHGVLDSLPYIFYVLFELPGKLPQRSGPDRRNLFFLRHILRQSEKIPNYDNAMVVPDPASVPAVNAVFVSLAKWAKTGLRNEIQREYASVAARFAGPVSKALGLDKPNPALTQEAFEKIISEDPLLLWVDGDYLQMAMTLLDG